MTTTDYLISAALILLVIPQMRGGRLTPRTLLLPLVSVSAAAAQISRPAGKPDLQCHEARVHALVPAAATARPQPFPSTAMAARRFCRPR